MPVSRISGASHYIQEHLQFSATADGSLLESTYTHAEQRSNWGGITARSTQLQLAGGMRQSSCEEVIGTLADDDIDADAWDVAFDRLRSEYLR